MSCENETHADAVVTDGIERSGTDNEQDKNKEQILGNESNRDEEEEMDQGDAENKISLYDEGKEDGDQDLENLMQDDNEDMQKNTDDTDGKYGAGSSRSSTS